MTLKQRDIAADQEVIRRSGNEGGIRPASWSPVGLQGTPSGGPSCHSSVGLFRM